MSDDSKSKAAGLVATVVFHAVIAALLLWLGLSYTGDPNREWPPVDTSELLLEGEYVKLGDTPVPQPQPTSKVEKVADDSKPAAAPEADDMVDAGEPAESTPPVQTSVKESPMKVKPEPPKEKTGPSKAELEAQAKAKREAETQQRINQRVSFGKGKNSSASGNPGQADGNSASGALSGKPGFNLAGRTLESWSAPRGRETGTIIVSVRVDREGRVVEAKYKSGSGAISTDAAARRSCEQAAAASRFSVDANARAEQMGTITYRFE